MNIIIQVRNYGSYIKSLLSSFNSKDLYFNLEYDDYEQVILQGFSPHIEKITSERFLIKRIISLNILLNGALFIASLNSNQKVKFESYETKNDIGINKDNYYGFWTDTIEEYPFENNEEYYLANKNLPLEADLDVMLFGIAKFDYIIRTLLFQAGFIYNNGIHDKILTWNTLYKMVDTIKFGCKEEDIDFEEMIDKNSLNRFTAACNNPTILGIYSRHGGKGKEIKKFQSLEDIEQAISLILCFAKNFATLYVTKKKYINIPNFSINKCIA